MKRVGIVANHVASPQAYDIIIRNGTIFDGMRTPRFVSDVGIKDGKVATIGRISKEAKCGREIDATGLHVCPGFVDLHTHYDAQVFWDPYLTIGGWHGVTSVVIGNCGFGYAPCRPNMRVRYMQALERNEAVPYEAQAAGMPWDWETYPEYLDSVDRAPKGVNIMCFIGLSPIMIHVMGLEEAKKRPATKEEMSEMRAILREAMEAGACGFSAQLAGNFTVQRDYDGTPTVTDNMSNDDLGEFAKELGEIGRGFVQLTPASGHPRELRKCELVAALSGRPVIYNALAVGTDQHGQVKGNLADHRHVLQWLRDQNNQKGLRIFGQAITQDQGFRFTFENWNLFDGSPAWRDVTLGTVEERMASMRDPEKRQAIIEEYNRGGGPLQGKTGLQADTMKLNGVQSESLKQYEGMSLDAIATKTGKHICDAVLDISLEDKLKSEWNVQPRGLFDDGERLDSIREIAKGEFCLPGVSDGGAHTKYLTIGTFPTDYLNQVVKEHNIMDLEEAHWRLSFYPAQAAGMTDRGSIAVGMPADILVYDFKNLKVLPEEILYDFPGGEWRRSRRADGYRCIIVNGEVTFENNKCTGATPGRLLRHGQASN